MSLYIEESKVSSVLLADGWHSVLDNSFETDSYEFHSGDYLTVGGGAVPGVPHTGFRFTDDDYNTVAGPLTAILAVRTLAGVSQTGT